MIVVTGANGYVGGHLVARLLAGGESVRAVVRKGCRESEKEFLGRLGAEVAETDFEDPAGFERALDGATAIVHLVGSIERARRGGYHDLHTGKTRRLLEAARGSGAGARIVYLSAIGAASDAGNEYHRTKWEAEEEIRCSGREYRIVRSSLIAGREVGSRESKIVRRLAGMALDRRSVPVIGGGRNLLQPIYISDLVACLERAALGGGPHGDTWEVGGPEVLTMRRITEIIVRSLGLERKIVSVPYPLAFALAVAARAIGMDRVINLDQVKMTRHDNVCRRNAAVEILNGRLVPFEEGMKRTVARFGAEGVAGR